MRGFFWKVIGVAAATCRLAFASGAATDSSKVVASISDSVAVGKPAPDFKLHDQSGTETALKDFRGKWVVLYFYPKDFTGGCTIEAHNFQRDIAAYEKINAVILGVSVDRVGSHKDFCAKEGLNFKLLADTATTVSSLYGSLKNLIGIKIAARNTFVIDPQGKVAKIFLGVKPPQHSEEVLAALAELQKKKSP
jgi:peroxiredoxin Q/BCP